MYRVDVTYTYFCFSQNVAPSYTHQVTFKHSGACFELQSMEKLIARITLVTFSCFESIFSLYMQKFKASCEGLRVAGWQGSPNIMCGTLYSYQVNSFNSSAVNKSNMTWHSFYMRKYYGGIKRKYVSEYLNLCIVSPTKFRYWSKTCTLLYKKICDES